MSALGTWKELGATHMVYTFRWSIYDIPKVCRRLTWLSSMMRNVLTNPDWDSFTVLLGIRFDVNEVVAKNFWECSSVTQRCCHTQWVLHTSPMSDRRLSLILFRFRLIFLRTGMSTTSSLKSHFPDMHFQLPSQVQSNEIFVRVFAATVVSNEIIIFQNSTDSNFLRHATFVHGHFLLKFISEKLSYDRSHLHKRNLPALCQSKFKSCFFLFVLHFEISTSRTGMCKVLAK